MIARASIAFGRLKGSVWERKGLSLDTKLKVYRASLLYVFEIWTIYSRYAQQLNAFHARCLRILFRVTWRDRVSLSIHTIVLCSQLRWAGHVQPMDDCCLPKRLLYGELSTGKRSLGRPKLHYKDTLKVSLKHCGIPYTTWESLPRTFPHAFPYKIWCE